MKTLQQFIQESLDNNTLWKLDTWFTLYPDTLSEFEELLVLYKEQKSLDLIQAFIYNSFYFVRCYKEFINFVEDDLHPTLEKDYIQALEYLLKYVLDNKSNKNTYNKSPNN